MKVTAVVLTILCLAAANVMPAGAAGWDPEKGKEDLAKVEKTVESFKQKNPRLNTFFQEAFAYAVFPTVVKGGFGIGGAHGKGKVFQGDVFIGNAGISQATIGFQLGGQTYSELIFFKDAKSLEQFKHRKVKLAAQASIVAIDAGKSATAAYNKGVAVFVLPKKGFMYEASIGGQVFKFKPKK